MWYLGMNILIILIAEKISLAQAQMECMSSVLQEIVV
jgi:hypothetical protein